MLIPEAKHILDRVSVKGVSDYKCTHSGVCVYLYIEGSPVCSLCRLLGHSFVEL